MSPHFKVIQELTKGNITVTTDTQYNNLDADKVVVEENVSVRIYGKVKTLVLKKNSEVIIHGIIHGDVQNEGGEIRTFGN
jgi:hypothetical protein